MLERGGLRLSVLVCLFDLLCSVFMRSSEELGGFVNAEQAGSKRPIVCCPCRFGVCWNSTKAFFNWEHVDLGCWLDWSCVVGHRIDGAWEGSPFVIL